MKRFLSLLAAVVVLAVLPFALHQPASVAFADQSGTKWEVLWVKWDSAGTKLDYKTIGDEADSSYTETIDTSNWDWSAIPNDVSAQHSIAYAVYTVTGTNTATDSLYPLIVKGMNGKFPTRNFGDATPGVSSSAISPGQVNTTVFVQYLSFHAVNRSPDLLVPRMPFKLKVFGDQSGSSAKVSRVKLEIIYPKRAIQ